MSKGRVKKPRTIIGISKRKTNILKLKKDELFTFFFACMIFG